MFKTLFELSHTDIQGCFEIQPKVFADQRGKFVKLFHAETFGDRGLAHTFRHVKYATYPKDVLSGPSFPLPPHAHVSLVACIRGCILNVVVDLRKKSNTFRKVHVVSLNAAQGNMLYIPEGLAHGFLSLENDSCLVSMATNEVPKQFRGGIHWESIGFNWPVHNAIVSEADQLATTFDAYESPF